MQSIASLYTPSAIYQYIKHIFSTILSIFFRDAIDCIILHTISYLPIYKPDFFRTFFYIFYFWYLLLPLSTKKVNFWCLYAAALLYLCNTLRFIIWSLDNQHFGHHQTQCNVLVSITLGFDSFLFITYLVSSICNRFGRGPNIFGTRWISQQIVYVTNSACWHAVFGKVVSTPTTRHYSPWSETSSRQTILHCVEHMCPSCSKPNLRLSCINLKGSRDWKPARFTTPYNFITIIIARW